MGLYEQLINDGLTTSFLFFSFLNFFNCIHRNDFRLFILSRIQCDECKDSKYLCYLNRSRSLNEYE